MEFDGYIISADRKKMFYNKGQVFGMTATGKKPEPGKGIINTSAISVKIDPLAEWPQIFDEAWRVNRDYFYDPGYAWNGLECNENKILTVPSRSCLQKRPEQGYSMDVQRTGCRSSQSWRRGPA